MPIAVPSHISAFIKETVKESEVYSPAELEPNIGALARLVTLFDQIPTQLFVLAPPEYAKLAAGIETVRMAVDKIRRGGKYDELVPVCPVLPSIWKLIKTLPDSVPSQSHNLAFITDATLCAMIGSDIESVRIDIESADWKGATVIAGSCIEALLLYGLQEIERKNAGTLATASSKVHWGRRGAPNLTDLVDRSWDLYAYSTMALNAGLITFNTFAEVDVGRDYRNLIHPSKVIREKTACDRGTALVGAGAIEHVIRDLTQNL